MAGKQKKTRSLKIMNMHIPYHIAMIVWSFIAIFPLYFLLINTFKVKKEIYTNFFGLPKKWTLENYQAAWRIVECGNEIPPDLKQAACGSCRIRDGYTVLVRREDAVTFESREASLEEIMVHLEKEAEEA